MNHHTYIHRYNTLYSTKLYKTRKYICTIYTKRSKKSAVISTLPHEYITVSVSCIQNHYTENIHTKYLQNQCTHTHIQL